MKVRVHVTLKPGVLDVQGKAVTHALHSLGHEGVLNVRQGKFFTFDVAPGGGPVEARVDDMCRKLLANTVIEDYRFEILERAAGADDGAASGSAAGGN